MSKLLDFIECKYIKTPLCLWVKINVNKMNLVFYLTYVLRGIPVLIPKKYFLQIDRIFRKCMWDSSSPRLSLVKLRSLLRENVFNLSDLQKYHCTYILSAIGIWNENI